MTARVMNTSSLWDDFQGLRVTRGDSSAGYVKMFTARAMTSPRMAIEITDCTAIVIFAHGTRGITSVGLKAVALVKPRYR